MNNYASVPHDIKGRVKEAASKALENDVRYCVNLLEKFGESGHTEAVLEILNSLIGESSHE